MEYFVRGTAHFFNLFAEFLDYCEQIIYFIFLVIFLLLVVAAFSKIRNSLLNVVCAYLKLFKFLTYIIAFLMLVITTYLTYTLNDQFGVLSLFVCVINFIIETFKVYDSSVLKGENTRIFKLSNFSNILITNLILIFFKTTYWSELYVFDIGEIKYYFIGMISVIIIQIIYLLMFKIYSIYDVTFKYIKSKSNYPKSKKIADMAKLLFISKNDINIFRLARLYLQKNIVNKNSHSRIIDFIYFSKSIHNDSLKNSNIETYNSKCYEHFEDISNKFGSEIDG